MRATQYILTLREVREYGPSLEEIFAAVGKALRIGRLDLISPHRAQHLTEARQIFYWFARNYTARSNPEIGRFIKRDHSTIIHGVNKINSDLPRYWPRIVLVADTLGIDLNQKEAA